jgi:hypothetical protein
MLQRPPSLDFLLRQKLVHHDPFSHFSEIKAFISISSEGLDSFHLPTALNQNIIHL